MQQHSKRSYLFVAVFSVVALSIAALPVVAQNYTVDINPANFVAAVDNPFFPHLPGMRWVYEGQTQDGLEHDEITVVAEKHTIMGVETTAARDIVKVDNELIEDTYTVIAS